MLAGVITILQCMIYFILSFFFFLMQVDNSSEEVQVNRNSGLETYGQEFDTTNRGGGANVQTNEIK